MAIPQLVKVKKKRDVGSITKPLPAFTSSDTLDDVFMPDIPKLIIPSSARDPSYFYNANEIFDPGLVHPEFNFQGMDYKLEGEQFPISKMIMSWLYENPRSRQKFKRLAGFAGTGKTMLISYLLKSGYELMPNYMKSKQIVVCTYTWKAALVLRSRGVDACSIHSIFYKVEGTNASGPIFIRRTPEEIREAYSLIVVDEASMVDFFMRQDLEASGVPVLYVGDGGQLPPISTVPEDATFMEDAEFRLTKIRRQALDSAIIRLSIDIREGKRIQYGKYGDGVFKYNFEDVSNNVLLKSDQLICGKNNTRRSLNDKIRKLKGYDLDSMPQEGEKIIGLNNVLNKGMYNGQFWFPTEDYSEYGSENGSSVMMRLQNELDETSLINAVFPDDIKWKQFKSQAQALNYFREKEMYSVDYGHCITCHKSQGSSFKQPLIFEEWLGDKNFHKKWLYTAVTRAVSKVVIIT